MNFDLRGGTMRSLLCVLSVLLAGAASAQQPVKIRAAYVVPVANWASIVFEKPGLARHQGKSYSFESVHFQGTPQMITALANNELEVADLAFASLAIAIQNAGMDELRVIGDEFQDGVDGYYTDEFFVLKGSPVKSVKDLKGKVVATNVAGSAVDIIMRAMLRKNGLDDRKDVSTIETAFPNMKATLLSKKADIVPGVIPFNFDPEFRAATRVLFTQKEVVGRTQMIIWAARAGFLQKNRAAMVDFMEDTIRAVRWYLDPANHKEAVEIAARVSKRPAAAFDKWLFTKNGQNGDYYHDADMKPDLKALQANIDLQHELGLVKATLDVRKHADLSIIEEAAKRLK
jgi:sulfonate transport system substrate-binding protein